MPAHTEEYIGKMWLATNSQYGSDKGGQQHDF